MALSIALATALDLAASGVAVTGPVPPGLPSFTGPMLRLRDVEGIFPLALGCLLLAYIESVSAARTLRPNMAMSSIRARSFSDLVPPISQPPSVVGIRWRVVCRNRPSTTRRAPEPRSPSSLPPPPSRLCLLFLANTLANLPKAVLAAIVLTAVYGLINLAAMLRIWRISRIDFYAAAIALVAVLLLGILQGILLAAAASVLLLLARASHPHVAFLGRIPGTDSYSDLDRHPENEQLPTVIAFRPEASLLYVNAEAVMDAVMNRLAAADPRKLRLCICDLSASPTSTSQAHACCTAFTPSWQAMISRCASSARAAGCATFCGPMALPTRWAVSIDSPASMI